MIGEPITVAATGETLYGLIDPQGRKLYLSPDASVVAGDVLSFRGGSWRATVVPEVWAGAGVVVTYEEAAVLLPDTGQLFRNSTAKPVLDRTTGKLAVPADDPVWSGPCLVEAVTARAGAPIDLGDQPIENVPYLVTVPLSLVDVRSTDQFRVTSSRDGRLVTRLLTITAVRGSSSALVRELVAFDNQGGG